MLRCDDMMRVLGYSQAWIDVGVIDEAFVGAQYAERQRSADKSAEHYRIGAFANFLQAHAALGNDKLAEILALEDADSNDLRVDRAIRLIGWSGLTDPQLEILGGIPQPTVHRRYVRERTMRALNAHGLSIEVLLAIRSSGDARLHEVLMTYPDVPESELEWLIENAKTRAVRNRATEALRGRRRKRRA